jgi:hypothetical protein
VKPSVPCPKIHDMIKIHTSMKMTLRRKNSEAICRQDSPTSLLDQRDVVDESGMIRRQIRTQQIRKGRDATGRLMRPHRGSNEVTRYGNIQFYNLTTHINLAPQFLLSCLKISPITHLKRRSGERRYSSNSFTTSALDRGEWSASRPGRALLPGDPRYPSYARLGGPQSRSGHRG